MKAVVFVDVQKDFITGALRNEKAIEVTPKIVEFAKSLIVDLAPNSRLYATRDTHEKTEYLSDEGCKKTCEQLECEPTKIPKAGYLSTLEGKLLPVEHCIEGTNGWMLDDSLMDVLYGHCTFVNKPTFGSFDLAEIIDEDFIDTPLDEIVLCGFVTSICLLANAIILRAKFPNVKITVMKDLCAGISDEDHNAALKCLEMQQINVE